MIANSRSAKSCAHDPRWRSAIANMLYSTPSGGLHDRMALEPAEPPIAAVKTSPLAIWSLVLGILGLVLLVVCVGPLFAIPGVICGHLAYSRIKRSGGVLTGEGIALAGIITGYVSIALALVWIPLMIAIAVPNFVKARQTAQTHACINNLQQIESAKQQWVLENKKGTNETPTAQDLAPFLSQTFSSLHCPAGGTYTINKASELPTCSIQNHRLLKDYGSSTIR